MDYNTDISKYGNFIHAMGISFSLKAINEKEFRIETREIREDDDSVKNGYIVIYLSKDIFFVTPTNDVKSMFKLSEELTKIISISLYDNSHDSSKYEIIDAEKIKLYGEMVHVYGMSFSLKSIDENEFRIETREIHDDNGKIISGFIVINIAKDSKIITPNNEINEIMETSKQLTSFISEHLSKLTIPLEVSSPDVLPIASSTDVRPVVLPSDALPVALPLEVPP